MDQLNHKDGIPWYEAPIPRRLHRCSVQTTGWVDFKACVEQCACGATRRGLLVMSSWRDKNSRRKSKKILEFPGGH